MFIDQNAALCPSSPLEPLFRAVLVQAPDFSLRDVDLVTDRGNIRKLLRFVQGSTNEHFRILVEVVGDGDSWTALFTRVETKTTETIRGFCGFGRSFEKAYTVQQPEMNGYYRIIRYSFGGLGCVVRHETDGYVPSDSGGVDALAVALGGLAIAEEEKTSSGLAVVKLQGRADVPLDSTLEIKTRAASKVLDMDDVLPQLWVSQTPKLAVGYYAMGGVFTNVKVQDMTDKIAFWEAASRGELEKLASLLRTVISVVRKSGVGQAVVECAGGSSLQVVAGDGRPALPDDLYGKLKVKIGASEEADVETNRQVDKGKAPKEPDSLIPPATPFAPDMEYAIRKGPRQFFVRLPGNLPDYRSVCQSIKMLSPEAVSKVLGRISFTYKDMMADFRLGKSDYDFDEGRETDGLKTASRDGAFRLVYMFLAGGAEAEDRNAAFNAAFFVVSHPSIFKPRTRRIVREAFEGRFSITYKQRVAMDEYRKTRDVEDFDSGEDETTEEEVYRYSDYSSDGYWD